ncbi:MAG TPA: AmmeMemoRadiSam system protein B, partial [Planctomycetota bacterium]|nr:AmmeMemoRadiSam system protein B [Planctomycetota bacterium]
MLPFLQVLRDDVDVVMMSIYPAAHLKDLLEIAHDLAAVLRATDPRPLLLASTDMTHHMHASAAEKQDRLVIDRMVELDAEGMYEVVAEHDISMCGVCPVTMVIACARELGATTGRLVRYENSGKATGDHSSVVAYAGLVFK